MRVKKDMLLRKLKHCIFIKGVIKYYKKLMENFYD